MAIALPSLLKLANFSQDKIDQLMKNIDRISEEEKINLSDTAWSFISTKYYANLALYKIRILDEVKQGKRKFNQNDIEEVKAKLIHDLVQKLQTVETEFSIAEVRKQLEKFSPPN